ncbi:MAG: methyltransferase domain-containing protein [Phycisphaerae bacterium]|nr:methyltransferase domain-containing protein [Phycisphaerae bacterium]
MPHEFDGDRYTKASTHQKEWGAKLISEIAFRGDERILDLGCGDGVLTARLAKLVPDGEVIGIDASAGMIEASRKLEGGNLRFDLMDINEIRLDGHFDLIFSNAALHWVLDHERLLANVSSLLTESGVARFNFAGDGNCATFYNVVKEVMALAPFRDHLADFRWPWYMPAVDEYQDLVAGVPFAESRVWGENADRYFPDADALVRWIDQPSIVPFRQHLAGNHEQAFRDAVVERMIRQTHQPDGTYFETFRRINLLARK